MKATLLSFVVLFLVVDQFALLITGNILFLIDSCKKTHAIWNPSTKVFHWVIVWQSQTNYLTAHTMFFIGTSNFELKLDFIIYSFLLRLYRDYRDYDALIMFNFHLFKKLNGSVFFCEVLFLKFLTFLNVIHWRTTYHAINISFTVTYATHKKKKRAKYKTFKTDSLYLGIFFVCP